MWLTNAIACLSDTLWSLLKVCEGRADQKKKKNRRQRGGDKSPVPLELPHKLGQQLRASSLSAGLLGTLPPLYYEGCV